MSPTPKKDKEPILMIMG
ncbi:MAG: hypothetical protein QG567_1351, partial [Campylobacterota bacterium]|nr:hypothetical protein [Campylobacterota bacterium]